MKFEELEEKYKKQVIKYIEDARKEDNQPEEWAECILRDYKEFYEFEVDEDGILTW